MYVTPSCSDRTLSGLGSPRRGIPLMYIRFNIPFESNYSYNQYPSTKLTKSETYE